MQCDILFTQVVYCIVQVSPHASILGRSVPSRPVYPAGRDGTGRVFSKDHGIAATLGIYHNLTLYHHPLILIKEDE